MLVKLKKDALGRNAGATVDLYYKKAEQLILEGTAEPVNVVPAAAVPAETEKTKAK